MLGQFEIVEADDRQRLWHQPHDEHVVGDDTDDVERTA